MQEAPPYATHLPSVAPQNVQQSSSGTGDFPQVSQEDLQALLGDDRDLKFDPALGGGSTDKLLQVSSMVFFYGTVDMRDGLDEHERVHRRRMLESECGCSSFELAGTLARMNLGRSLFTTLRKVFVKFMMHHYAITSLSLAQASC